MGLKDIVTKELLVQKEYFGDLIHYYLLKSGIDYPVNIKSINFVDTNVLKSTKDLNIQRARDTLSEISVLLADTDDAYYALTGIENQTEEDYTMPIRNMVYDALTYDRQLKKANKKSFINVKPVITITVYWGDKPWKAPTTLKEMIGNHPLKRFVQDYNINLINPNDFTNSDISLFETELKLIFDIARNRNNENILNDIISNNEYSNISESVKNTICNVLNVDIPVNESGGRYDMCDGVKKFLDKMLKEKNDEIAKQNDEINKKDNEIAKQNDEIMKLREELARYKNNNPSNSETDLFK